MKRKHTNINRDIRVIFVMKMALFILLLSNKIEELFLDLLLLVF